MRKGYRNDYLEAFGSVHWAKKAVFKKILGVSTTPLLRRTRVKMCMLFSKVVLTILRYSTKHANFSLVVQYPLNCMSVLNESKYAACLKLLYIEYH